MPIVRSYICPECNHHLEVTLRAEQWEAPAPACPRCTAWDVPQDMQQEFKPFGIGGSARARAVALAEDIARNDYAVADMQPDNRAGGNTKVRYAELKPDAMPGLPRQALAQAARVMAQAPAAPSSNWMNPATSSAALETAIALGRDTRLRHGSGLDVLQGMLNSGDQPDLIESSKRRSMKIW